VAVLHKALGDGRGVKRYIANHVGRGYAFVAPVTRKYPSAAADPPNGASEGNDLPGPAHTHRRPRRCHRRTGGTACSPSLPDHRRCRWDRQNDGGGRRCWRRASILPRASYKDGVWFVASLSKPELVPSALAGALGILPSNTIRCTG